ncbi:hypothetical protein FRB99_006599 [Tulasnella sp. 403]|nr:hypothetical protein FRB99_006599 [Tulasnella sp. 403]
MSTTSQSRSQQPNSTRLVHRNIPNALLGKTNSRQRRRIRRAQDRLIKELEARADAEDATATTLAPSAEPPFYPTTTCGTRHDSQIRKSLPRPTTEPLPSLISRHLHLSLPSSSPSNSGRSRGHHRSSSAEILCQPADVKLLAAASLWQDLDGLWVAGGFPSSLSVPSHLTNADNRTASSLFGSSLAGCDDPEVDHLDDLIRLTDIRRLERSSKARHSPKHSISSTSSSGLQTIDEESELPDLLDDDRKVTRDELWTAIVSQSLQRRLSPDLVSSSSLSSSPWSTPSTRASSLPATPPEITIPLPHIPSPEVYQHWHKVHTRLPNLHGTQGSVLAL